MRARQEFSTCVSPGNPVALAPCLVAYTVIYEMHKFNSVYAMVKATRPEQPVYCLRPSAVTIATKWFQDNFPGRVLFAVKTNPEFVRTVFEAGLDHFDVASLGEIELVNRVAPGARMSFMHPVKSREAIRRAYFDYGVRDFSLDTQDELDKILTETNEAQDLNLFVRISVSNRHSNHSLAGKFGTRGKEAQRLLFRARQYADKLGICFHAGSQLMNPEAFRIAMQEASALIIKSGVIIDIMDVGGGFPSVYPGLVPPPLKDYIKVIHESFEESMVLETCELWCEPGRALVAEGASLVVKVELRKGNSLYLNDGTYGGLFDAGQPAMVYPVRKVSLFDPAVQMEEFSFFGPTCDSIDAMRGPFVLPADIDEGDYIEIDNMGAYSVSMRTAFNHFGECSQVIVDTVPALSLYQGDADTLVPAMPASTAPGKAFQAGGALVPLKNAKPGANIKALKQETNHDAG